MEGFVNEFAFKKRTSFSKTYTPFLQVKYKNIVINQYEIGEWNRIDFDEIIAIVKQ